MTQGSLQGRKILLVEDEFFQAREVKGILEQAGADVVGPTGRAEDVPRLIAAHDLDAALIDINLGLGPNFKAAEALRRAAVPFAFVTGYGQAVIPAELGTVPCLEKPFSESQVIDLVQSLVLNRREATPGS